MPSALTGQERIDFWILSSGQFLLFCGFFSFFQFPLYIQHQGGDEVQIGVIMGVTSLASTLLLPWIIALVDRVERRRVMLIGMILMEAATMACIATEAPDVFMGTLMVLRGFGIAVYMNASGAYIAQILPPEEKSRWIGINFGFNQIAIGVGPLLGDLIITRVGFPFFFFMATAFIFSGMLFILTITSRVPEPVERPFHPLESLTYFFREINGPRFRVPFITLLLVAGVVSAVFNFTATFMQKIGLPSGVFFTVYAGVNVMCRFFISGRTDRLPRWLVVVPSLGVMALGLLAYSVTANLTTLVISAVLIGVGFGLSNPAMLAQMLDRSPGNMQGMAVGLFHFSYQLGALSGAPAFGFVAGSWGYPAMLWISAALTIAAALVFMRTRAPAHPPPLRPTI